MVGPAKAGNGSEESMFNWPVRRIVGRIAGVIGRIIWTDVLAFHKYTALGFSEGSTSADGLGSACRLIE